MKKLLLLLSLLLLTACDGIVRKTPLEWCLWEIHTYEDYDCELSYIYNELNNYDDEDKNPYLKAFYITVFTEDRKGEWYCFIECEHKSLFERMLNRNVYTAYEVNAIDCDLAFERFYQGGYDCE